jgi:hypothetical protein
MSDSAREPVEERRRRALLFVGAVIPIAAGAALIATAAVLFHGHATNAPTDAEVVAAMAKAGCVLKTFPAQSREHVTDVNARIHYNSFPPTSGPHYFAPVDWGFYLHPVVEIMVVHNLEHGGIVIQFGTKIQGVTVEKLFEFYRRDPRLLVMAPLPKLGKRIALAAWTVPPHDPEEPPKRGLGRLALCTHFADEAFRDFVDAYRDRGPEIEPPH